MNGHEDRTSINLWEAVARVARDVIGWGNLIVALLAIASAAFVCTGGFLTIAYGMRLFADYQSEQLALQKACHTCSVAAPAASTAFGVPGGILTWLGVGVALGMLVIVGLVMAAGFVAVQMEES